MQQVYVGPPADVREVIRGLTILGIDAIGMSVDQLGRMTLFVPPEDVVAAEMFVGLLEDIEVAAARRRVSDAVTFRGGRSVEGRA